jgi:hypothetical protein
VIALLEDAVSAAKDPEWMEKNENMRKNIKKPMVLKEVFMFATN